MISCQKTKNMHLCMFTVCMYNGCKIKLLARLSQALNDVFEQASSCVVQSRSVMPTQ